MCYTLYNMISFVHILQYVQYSAIRAVYEPSRDITICTILLYEYYIVHCIVHILYMILCTIPRTSNIVISRSSSYKARIVLYSVLYSKDLN